MESPFENHLILSYSLTNDESQKDGSTYLSSWVTTYARALQLPLKLR